MGDLEALTCDGALRQRLVRRYGSGIDAWLYALPPDPGELASRRRIEPISRSDPAPCIGGPIYDLIDLRLWRARDPLALAERARHLAPAVGAGADRLFDRCAAFAAMIALAWLEDAGPPYEPNALVAFAGEA